MSLYQAQIEMILTSSETNAVLKAASEDAAKHPGSMLLSYIKMDSSNHLNNQLSLEIASRAEESELNAFAHKYLPLSPTDIEVALKKIRDSKLIDKEGEKQLLVFFLFDGKFYIDRIRDVSVFF